VSSPLLVLFRRSYLRPQEPDRVSPRLNSLLSGPPLGWRGRGSLPLPVARRPRRHIRGRTSSGVRSGTNMVGHRRACGCAEPVPATAELRRAHHLSARRCNGPARRLRAWRQDKPDPRDWLSARRGCTPTT